MTDEEQQEAKRLINQAQRTGVLRPPRQTTPEQIDLFMQAALEGRLANLNVLRFKDCRVSDENAFGKFAQAAFEGKLSELRWVDFDESAGVTAPHFGKFVAAIDARRLTNLSVMRFAECPGVTEEHFGTFLKAISDGGKTDRLRVVRLNECPGVTEEHFATFANLAVQGKLSRISGLYFNGCSKIESESFGALVGAIADGKLPHLAVVDFAYCPGVTENNFETFANAAAQGHTLKRLRAVCFSECQGVTEGNFKTLANAIAEGKLPRVSGLYFNECSRIEKESFGVLVDAVAAGDLPHLSTVCFAACPSVTESNFKTFANAAAQGKLSRISRLHFTNCSKIERESFGVLVGAIANGKLPHLSMVAFAACPGATEEHFATFANAIAQGKLSRIAELNFNDCSDIKKESFGALVGAIAAGQLPHLSVISFAACPGVTETNFATFANAADRGEIKYLGTVCFNRCPGVTEKHFATFANAIVKGKLSQIEELYFNGCSRIDRESLGVVVGAIADGKLPHLSTIGFAACPGVTESNFATFANAADRGEMKCLESVCFNRCPGVTEKHFATFANAIREGKLSRIAELYFGDCPGVTHSNTARLANAWRSGQLPRLSQLYLASSTRRIAGRIDEEASRDEKAIQVDRATLASRDPERIFRAFFEGEQRTVVKAVILGKQERGKSWFCERVIRLREPTEESVDKTWSFDFHDVQWQAGIRDQEMIVVDLAGELHLHGLHELVLDGAEIVILVLADDEPPEEPRDPRYPHVEPEGGNDLEYWSGFLRHKLSDRQATVVVRTKCDTGTHKLGEVDYKETFALLNADGMPRDDDPLVIDPFDSKCPGEFTPVAEAQRILAGAAQRVERGKNEAGLNALAERIRREWSDRLMAPLSDYYQWCRDSAIGANKLHGKPDAEAQQEWDQLLPVLQRLGVLFCFKPTKEDDLLRQDGPAGNGRVSGLSRLERMRRLAKDSRLYGRLHSWVLSPTLLNQPLYSVLHEGKGRAGKGGQIDESTLREIIQQKNPNADTEQVDVVQRLLELTEFCHRSSNENGGAVYRFPLFQGTSMARVADSPGEFFVLRWPFLDLSAIHQVIVRWFPYLERSAAGELRYWVRGMTTLRASYEGAEEVVIELVANPLEHTVTVYFERDVSPDHARDVYLLLLKDLIECHAGSKPDAPTPDEIWNALANDGDGRSTEVIKSTTSRDVRVIDETNRCILSVATEWFSRHGGISTFNRELCTALARTGEQVVCVVPKATDSEIQSAWETDGVTLVEAPPTAIQDPTAALLRRPQLPNGCHPKMVIGHGRITGPYAEAQVADYFQDAFRIHFIHMVPGEIEYLKGKPDAAKVAEERDRQELHLCQGADLVAAVGPRIDRAIQTLLTGLESHHRVHRFNPGINRPSPPETRAPNVQCLVLGRAEDLELKGVDIAARALALLQRSNPLMSAPTLVVRGAPEGTGTGLREQLLEIAENQIDIHAPEYTSVPEHIAQDLRRASVLLMPSRREGFGLVATEAIGLGIPVLVSNQSGVGELLVERLGPTRAANHVVPTTGDLDTDASQWSRAIEGVLRDRERAFQRSLELREELTQSFTWDAAATELLNACAEKLSH